MLIHIVLQSEGSNGELKEGGVPEISPNRSCSLNSLEGVISGIIYGTAIRVSNGFRKWLT